MVKQFPAKCVIGQGLRVAIVELRLDREHPDGPSPIAHTTVALGRLLYHFGQLDVIDVGAAVATSAVSLERCFGCRFSSHFGGFG